MKNTNISILKPISLLLFASFAGSCLSLSEDDGEYYLTAEQVDDYLEREQKLYDQVHYRIDGKDVRIKEIDPSDGAVALISDGGEMWVYFRKWDMNPTGDLVYLQGDTTVENSEFKRYDANLSPRWEGETFILNGELMAVDGKSIGVELALNSTVVSWGTSTLDVKDNKAVLTGELGTGTYQQMRDMIKNNPEVDTLVLFNVPGSVNDTINVHTGRLIRGAGLTILVPSDSRVASGGVDIFCSGLSRIVEKGGQLGVHSWEGDGRTALDYPMNHPSHQSQLDYFSKMLGDDLGPKFYMYTLNAAPADDIYWMTREEMEKFGLLTE